jgi:general secretion pathway protein D
VRVENGQTVFLAGLLSEEQGLTIDKVPVLGDIPLIGLLFQHKHETVKKTNLIIEIKPTIIRDSSDVAAATSIKETAGQDTVAAPAPGGQQQEPAVIERTAPRQPAPASKPQAAPADSGTTEPEMETR